MRVKHLSPCSVVTASPPNRPSVEFQRLSNNNYSCNHQHEVFGMKPLGYPQKPRGRWLATWPWPQVAKELDHDDHLSKPFNLYRLKLQHSGPRGHTNKCIVSDNDIRTHRFVFLLRLQVWWSLLSLIRFKKNLKISKRLVKNWPWKDDWVYTQSLGLVLFRAERRWDESFSIRRPRGELLFFLFFFFFSPVSSLLPAPLHPSSEVGLLHFMSPPFLLLGGMILMARWSGRQL